MQDWGDVLCSLATAILNLTALIHVRAFPVFGMTHAS